MPEKKMIPCPECKGRGDPGCVTCHQYGFDINTGTIPDRRAPTASDRAVERITEYKLRVYGDCLADCHCIGCDIMDIINEEAGRDQ